MSKIVKVTLSADDIGRLLLGGEIEWPFILSGYRDLQGVSVKFDECGGEGVRVVNDD